ncbi:MAG: TIR domain-containing protein [Sphingomicrobium sp.]
MASLFLSYSREDLPKVEPLAAALKGRGHQLWWDRDISGGQAFSNAIEKALENAEVVIVCWTSASIRSDWVRDEAAAGRDSGRLVPVTLDGCQPPLGFRQYQTIDLSTWDRRPKSADLNPLDAAIAERSGDGERIPREPMGSPARSLRRIQPRVWAAAGAACLLVLLAGVTLVPRFLTTPGNLEPKVAVGNFSLASPGLPPALSAMLGQEIVAAFGVENAVAVVSPGDRNVSRAPFVMDGSISSLGSAVRINVTLKDQRSGVVLWSGAFEHERADAVAARQAAVAASQVVRCGLWGASSYKKRMSDQALALYFKWCDEHWSGSTRETAELDAAKRVTVAVPEFSFGWSALALASVPLAATRTPEASRLREEGIAAARKSMALDRENPEGYMALAGLVPLNRFSEREDLLTKALEVRPTECGCERQAYGDFLASVGRMEEAAEQYERARDMRPLAPFSNLRFAQALYMIGREEEGDRLLEATLELWPDATSLRLLKMKSALWTRRYDDAIAILRSPDLPLTSTQRTALSNAFEALKSSAPVPREKATAELQHLSSEPRYNDKLVVGLLAALGAHKAALEGAANLVRARGLWQTEVLFEPNLKAASGELGYAELVGKLGLVRYWKEARKSPDICREQERPRFCS